MSTHTFQSGDIVFHAEHGPGRILEATESFYVIDFPNKKGHRIDSSIANRSLELASRDGLFAAQLDQPELVKAQVAQGNVDVVVNCLRDNIGGLSLAQIKKRLILHLPEGASWSTWWTKALRRVKKDGRIHITTGKNKLYFLATDITPKASLPSLENFLRADDEHTRFKEALAAIKGTSSQIEGNETALDPIRRHYSDTIQNSQALKERFFAAAILYQLSARLQENRNRFPSDEFVRVLPLDSNIMGELKNEEERSEVLRLFLNASDPSYQQFLVKILLQPQLNEGLSRQIVRRVIEESSFRGFLDQCDAILLGEAQSEPRNSIDKGYAPPVIRLLLRIAGAIADLRNKPPIDSATLASHLTAWISPSIHDVDAASIANAFLSLCSELGVPIMQVRNVIEMLFFERTALDRTLSEWKVILARHTDLNESFVEQSRRLLNARLLTSIFREEETDIALRRYLTLTSPEQAAKYLENVLNASGSSLGEITADWMFRQLRSLDHLDSYIQRLSEHLSEDTAPSENVSRRLLRQASRYAYPVEHVARLLDELYHLSTNDRPAHEKIEHTKIVLMDVSHSSRFITQIVESILSYGSEQRTLSKEREDLQRLLEDEDTIRQKAEPFIRQEVETRLRLSSQMSGLKQAQTLQQLVALLQEADSSYAQFEVFKADFTTLTSIPPERKVRVEALFAQMRLVRNAVMRLADSWNVAFIGSRGETLSYDPALHEDATALQLPPGTKVTCTTPGVLQNLDGTRTVIRKARTRSSSGG